MTGFTIERRQHALAESPAVHCCAGMQRCSGRLLRDEWEARSQSELHSVTTREARRGASRARLRATLRRRSVRARRMQSSSEKTNSRTCGVGAQHAFRLHASASVWQPAHRHLTPPRPRSLSDHTSRVPHGAPSPAATWRGPRRPPPATARRSRRRRPPPSRGPIRPEPDHYAEPGKHQARAATPRGTLRVERGAGRSVGQKSQAAAGLC